MKIIFEDEKIYHKTFLKKEEIVPKELRLITCDTQGIVTLHFYEVGKVISTHNILHCNVFPYCIQNNVSFEFVIRPTKLVTYDIVKEHMEKLKELIQPIVNELVQAHYGATYEVDITWGEQLCEKQALVLKLKDMGHVLEEHADYMIWEDEFPAVLDVVPVGQIIRWDAESGRAEYEIYEESMDPEYWKQLIYPDFEEIFQS